MTTKLTAEEAWDRSPPCLTTTKLYAELCGDDQKRVSQWFALVESSINSHKDAEIAQLKARIAELERPATTIQPRPCKTAGEKLCDVLLAHGEYITGWNSRREENRRALQAAATDPLIGLADDPDPPSDGELLIAARSAVEGGRGFYDRYAAKFLELLAERDGVQREND